jgi:hypothetical protein
MMMSIPEELLEQIERGNVLLFIGERIVRDAEGQVVLDELAAQLAARCGIANAEAYTFPEVAQAYEDDKGRHLLVQFLRDQLVALGDESQQAHRLIARLTDCNVLITTCLDRRLERAFEEIERPVDVIIGNVDVAFEDERKAQLYKLRGSVEQVESLVLTEDDYEDFYEDHASICVALQGYLARKTILFVGYDLADPHFKRLYRKVTAPLDDCARRAYAFGETPSPKACRWCKRHGIDVVEVDATAFLEALTRQLETRARPALAVPPPPVEPPAAPLPERPYKLLDYYESRDAAIFFGRREETQRLSALIHAHRLVLLHGASGVGKTSLLLAGVMPRLENADPRYETVYVRALEDPALVIRRTIRRRLPDADLPEGGSLVNVLDAATRALGCTLVIVLDQFEEFFMRLSPQFREVFIAELGALYDARDVPVKVVLSLREDWLAAISEIEERLPEVFRTRMRLLLLSRDQARQAITAPAERLGVSYEPTLVERLISDLAGGPSVASDTRLAVMPPQLQLVCSTLYDRLSPDEGQITLARYKELGGAAGILKTYLGDELARLGGAERTLARSILKELVDSQGNKRVCVEQDLSRDLGVTLIQLKPVLERLVRSHLIRPVDLEQRGETGYELAHQYLASEITQWFDPQESERKRVYELLRQDVERWQQFETPVTGPTLDRVALHWEDMLLQPDERLLILRSAIQQGWNAEQWIERLKKEPGSTDLMLELLHTPQEETRCNAVRGWRYMPADSAGDEALVEVALNDTVRALRTEAAVSLAHRVPRQGVELITSRTETSRLRRVEVLAHMWDETAPLRQLSPGLRLPVILALARIRLKRSGRALLYHSVAGIIGGIITGALGGLIISPNHWITDKAMWEARGFSFPAVVLAWLIMGPWFSCTLGTVMILSSTLPLALFKRPKRWMVLGSSGLLSGLTMGLMLSIVYQGNFLIGTLWQTFLNGFVMGSLGGGSVAWFFWHRQTVGRMPSPRVGFLLAVVTGLAAGTITALTYLLDQNALSELAGQYQALVESLPPHLAQNLQTLPWQLGYAIVWVPSITVGATAIIWGINLAIQNADKFIAGLSPAESKGGWFK